MKLLEVNQSKRVARMSFTGGKEKSRNEEKELIEKALERLIEKQKKNMDEGTRDDRDKKEKEKLEKYRMNKMIVERIPARHEFQEIGKPSDEIDVEEPEEENQITRTTLFDICNGLNELIADLRRDGTWKDENKERFERRISKQLKMAVLQ
jgi:hypothetical protein